MTRLGWGVRPGVRASGRRGGGAGRGVRGPRRGGRGCDTWCGSNSGRGPGRADWRRFRPAPGRRSVARAGDPARSAVAGRSAPVLTSAVGEGSPVARSAGRVGAAHWRVRRRARYRRPPRHAAGRRECDNGIGQGSPSLGASAMPSSSATFFWRSMIASARVRRSVRRALSRWRRTSSAVAGLALAVLRPRRAGTNAL